MGFISIQSLTLTLSVCLVIISGGLTGYMSISTGETALDDTRSMYEKGLADTESARDESLSACFTAGTSNSEELAGQLMAKVTDGIVSDLRGYLQVPKSIVTAMAHFGRLQGACTDSRGVIKDCPWLRPEWHRDVLQPMLYSMYRDARDLGVTEAVVLSLPYDMMQMQMYSHSPFTQTAANRERLGIPDDYRQDFHISWPAQTTCTLDMDRANCLARKPAPPFMDPAAWERGGEYPGTGGCTWCVRDTATNLKLSPFEPRYRRAGSCSDGNGCKYGFKNENTAASPEQKWRPWFTLSTPPAENGASIFGPCRDLKQAAQEAGRFPMTCPVPEVLQRFDYAMYRGLSLDVHAQQRDVLWSAPTAKGPFAALQVYSAWGHPDQWDYGDGLGNRIGLATAGVDLLSLSGMMKDIIGPLSPGTYLYAVQQDPWKLRAPPTNFKCVDDPHGLMAFAGISCSLLVGILGLSCETDLQSFSSTLKAYTWLYDNCPVSCNACPTDDGHGLLLGSSHGLAYEPLPLNESSYGDQGMADSLPINIRNAPDPVVRTHGRHVLSMRGADNRTMGYASVPSDIARWTYNPQDAAVNITSVTGAVREMPPGDGEPVLFWVKFGHLSDDAGLRLTIALLIPRDEAMKTIDIATAKTRTEAEQAAAAVRLSIQQSSDKTDEDKDDNFMLMIIIVVVACVVLIIISIVFVLSIIKPLLKLEQDMADVATMKLENVDLEEDPSKLEEVGNMQRSFITMVKNLIEYRNYMPQSILCGGEEEEEEEEQEWAEGDGLRQTTMEIPPALSPASAGRGQQLPRSSAMAGHEGPRGREPATGCEPPAEQAESTSFAVRDGITGGPLTDGELGDAARVAQRLHVLADAGITASRVLPAGHCTGDDGKRPAQLPTVFLPAGVVPAEQQRVAFSRADPVVLVDRELERAVRDRICFCHRCGAGPQAPDIEPGKAVCPRQRCAAGCGALLYFGLRAGVPLGLNEWRLWRKHITPLKQPVARYGAICSPGTVDHAARLPASGSPSGSPPGQALRPRPPSPDAPPSSAAAATSAAADAARFPRGATASGCSRPRPARPNAAVPVARPGTQQYGLKLPPVRDDYTQASSVDGWGQTGSALSSGVF
eukprot:TRINITY_DN1039_c0_g1_i5.p1 TRINITY_DN1039_c0_g1~~TRINITY_DN1039_c0_g1_i5.p1  ORF type:complete len:1114 (+),score=264.07 TRINITY_DN1039_c0_g1_i5:87-3428(+)